MLMDMESNIPPLTDILPWFKQLNGYLSYLMEACIREQYMDLIYGMQAWFKKLIRRIHQTLPEFKSQWSFEGLVGPLSKPASENMKSTVTWFQIAALFASVSYDLHVILRCILTTVYFIQGRDELAIKSLSTLKSSVIHDDFGILEMLDRQVIHFYACLEDYDALQETVDSGSIAINGFICDSLRSFNSGNSGFEAERTALMSNMEIFVKTAPLDSCLELARLDRFRQWATLSNDSNKLPNCITERILQVLKDGIFSNISSLLELQLLQSDWSDLVASAKDWLSITAGNLPNSHNVPPETKHWARLSTHFERLYTLNESEKQIDLTQCLGFIQLHSAKVARKQGNFALVERLIEKAVLVPDTKYLALYERTKVLFAQSNYTDAMKTINQVLFHTSSTSKYQELNGKAYLKIARYLKSVPANEGEALLKSLDSDLMETATTALQSSVENAIDFALEKATENNKEDGRPWFDYATHYYKQGWRILDEVLRSDSTMTSILWAREKMDTILSTDASIDDKKQVEKVSLP